MVLFLTAPATVLIRLNPFASSTKPSEL